MTHISWLVAALSLYKAMLPESAIHASVHVSSLPFEYSPAVMRGGWSSGENRHKEAEKGRIGMVREFVRATSAGVSTLLGGETASSPGKGMVSDGFWLREPTLMILEERLKRVMFVHADRSWLVVQDLGIKFPVRVGGKHLYGRECLKIELVGQKIVDIHFANGRLLVQTVGLGDVKEKQWLHILEIKSCDPSISEKLKSEILDPGVSYSHDLPSKKYFNGPSKHPNLSSHFVLNLNHLLPSKTQPYIDRVSMTDTKLYLEVAESPSQISLLYSSFTSVFSRPKKLDPLKFGCREILRIQPMKDRIVALCYQEQKLAIQVKLIVMKETPEGMRDPLDYDPTGHFHRSTHHRHRMVSEIYFTEEIGITRRKRNMRDLVKSWDSFQLRLSPDKTSVFGITPGSIFWLVQDTNNLGLEEPRMKLIRTPIEQENQPQDIKFLGNGEVYILFKDYSTATMPSSHSKPKDSLVLGVHKDLTKEWSQAGYLQTKFRLKGSDFKHFEVVVIDHEVFVITVDPESGVVMNHLITMPAYHQSKYTIFYLSLLICLFLAKIGLMMNGINAMCLSLQNLYTSYLTPTKKPEKLYPSKTQLVESVKYYDPRQKFASLDISTMLTRHQNQAFPNPTEFAPQANFEGGEQADTPQLGVSVNDIQNQEELENPEQGDRVAPEDFGFEESIIQVGDAIPEIDPHIPELDIVTPNNPSEPDPQ